MHVLLTGGSGFVGGNLAKLLVSRGHTVTALVRRSSKSAALKDLGCRIAIADFVTGAGFEAALEGVDVVQHIAGVTKARTEAEYLLGNAEGTRLLCAAMAKQKKPPRMVFCSSLAAAGPALVGKPRRESEVEAPVSMYGRSKLAGELAVRQFADRVPSIILRPPIVYGPGDTVNLPPLMQMGRFGIYLKAGLGPKHFSFIHVDDLTQALATASVKGKTLSADDPKQGIYFVADPTQYTWEEFCQKLSTAMGKRAPRVISLPDFMGYASGLAAELRGRVIGEVPILSRDKAREMKFEAWTCASELASNEMEFTAAHALDSGLANTMAWYRKAGML